MFLEVETATRWSCFWTKDSKTRLEGTDRCLFYLQIHGTDSPASLRITGFLLLRIPGKSFILPHNATIPTPSFLGLIPTFAPQKQPEKQLANNINGKQPPLFFYVPSDTHLLRSEASGGKKGAAAAVFSTGLHGSIPLSLSKPRA